MAQPPRDPSEFSCALRSGRLHLRVETADFALEELCGFASRRSRKRGFVFVSKVLGKHCPVRPRVMAETHQRLAAKIVASPNGQDAPLLPGPGVLVALAE